MQFKNIARTNNLILKKKIGEIEKQIFKLDETKALQKTDIPTRIMKKSIDIFAKFSCSNKSGTIKSASFPSSLELTDVTALDKKREKWYGRKF